MELIRKNDQLELDITSMSAEGSGIGRYEGMAVFVAGAAVGDRVLAHIIKVSKSYAIGKLQAVLAPSKDRIRPDCPVSGRCGGCAYRHISYEAECRIKWERVRDAVQRIGKLTVTPAPILGAKETLCYRNKAQYPVEIAGGEVRFGFYAERSHRLVPCDTCPLQPKLFEAGLGAVRRWAAAAGVTGYNEITGKGLLRHVYFRMGFGTGEVMACLVINGTAVPQPELLVQELTSALPGLKSLVLNINEKNTNVILGTDNKVLWGAPFITDKLLGLALNLSPNTFYQVNYRQTQVLYSLAKEYAGLTGNETVLDLYCGAGAIGLTMADKSKQVIGIEIVPPAVANAKENAAQNGIQNTEFLCMDAAQGAKELSRRGIRPDVVLLDPPRKGCGQALIDTVAQMAPERVVYVSCDPATLARDLAWFAEKGYETVKLTPVDLFPRTVHVETVCLLLHKETVQE